MSKEIMQTVLNQIKKYKRIIIFRHSRPDGDAIGSAKGLYTILSLTYPDKEIYLQSSDSSDYLSFLGGEDAPIADGLYADALGIVLDSATKERISSKKYSLCRELIKIDHHIPKESYAETEWIEAERSSCSEMIAALYDENRAELLMNTEAATYIYCGMVTDSGRFRYSSVSSETMRLAGVMLSFGIDTDRLFANLYLKDFDIFKFQAYAQSRMKITENGVVYLHITEKMQKKFGLSYEDASASVSFMENIKGSLIWLVFIDNGDGSIRVRLRSRFVTVNALAERYSGGGHACAAGATVRSKSEMKRLVTEADALLGEYKSKNSGWL